MNRNIKRVLLAIALLSVVILTANFPSSIRVGVDGRYTVIHMPLYIKWTEFLARHYEYVRLAKEITAGAKTDEDKALAILKWTKENLKDLPKGMAVHDDHILYIIIRGYAVPDQFQDVFTTLCVYSGFPSFYWKPYDKDHKTRYTFSFVRLNGKWRVFDAYYGKFFRNGKGEIASVDDIVNDPSIVSNADWTDIIVDGVPYREYFLNLKDVLVPRTLRAENQMPLPRLLFEIRKAFKIEKPSDDML